MESTQNNPAKMRGGVRTSRREMRINAWQNASKNLEKKLRGQRKRERESRCALGRPKPRLQLLLVGEEPDRASLIRFADEIAKRFAFGLELRRGSLQPTSPRQSNRPCLERCARAVLRLRTQARACHRFRTGRAALRSPEVSVFQRSATSMIGSGATWQACCPATVQVEPSV